LNTSWKKPDAIGGKRPGKLAPRGKTFAVSETKKFASFETAMISSMRRNFGRANPAKRPRRAAPRLLVFTSGANSGGANNDGASSDDDAICASIHSAARQIYPPLPLRIDQQLGKPAQPFQARNKPQLRLRAAVSWFFSSVVNSSLGTNRRTANSFTENFTG
jgi:hypothetical protein